MRPIITILLLLLTVQLTAQTILNASELCASLKEMSLCTPPAADDFRSDSLDILHTDIYLDVTDFSQKTIKGKALITLVRKSPAAQQLQLDLLDLQVDSLWWNSQLLDFQLIDDRIVVVLPASFGMGDTALVAIKYQGKPAQDASGWGGFYWQGAYAYNLGVGFAADPHNYGRVWFPCFDNFEERCSFSFSIETTSDKRAFCNGEQQGETILPNNNRLTYWWLDDPIPSYLACVAVGPYVSFERVYSGETGPVSVQIAVAPADSNALRNSFVHLPDAIAAFEHWYGPYRWSKVGYSVVPFNSGAMEHATNIAYMKPAVTGTTQYETLMAHELSHHWWGDLATCSTAEDMWLNEGWASFSEHLFLEWTYGKATYIQTVEDNYLDVLQNTHISEGGYRAVSGVPHDLTYGEHVYNKGASVAHNLRGYLGDSLFRIGLRAVLDQKAFDDWSSYDFENLLSTATGKDLSAFFDDWVFQPGFTDFYIDSTWISDAGSTTLNARVRQSLRGATHYFTNVPLEYTLIDDQGLSINGSWVMPGETGVIQAPLPFGAVNPRIHLNKGSTILQARAAMERQITANGTQNLAKAKMSLTISSVPDTTLVRVEHHFAAPTTLPWYNPDEFQISDRFWEVDGVWPAGFKAEATVFYDGRGGLDQLDNNLFELTGNQEDNITLVYRPAQDMPWAPWQEVANVSKNILGNPSDSWGRLVIPDLKRGQYAIAKKTGASGVANYPADRPQLNISPNPVTDYLQLDADFEMESVQVYLGTGQLIQSIHFQQVKSVQLETESWQPGVYQVVIIGADQTTSVKVCKVKQ